MEEELIVVEPEAPPPEPDPVIEVDPPLDLAPLLAAERSTSQSLRELLAAAAVSYRTAVLAAAPEVPPELVSGETPSEIDVSLEAARAIVAAVRQRTEHVAQPPPAVSIPAGAPVRSEPDLSAMSA